MKKRTSLQRRSGPPARRRNATSMSDVGRAVSRGVARTAGRARRRLETPEPPAWQDLLATALAGGGAATLGGYIVRKGVDPRIVSAVMMAGGAIGAFQFKGTLRTAATSIAGAGAGQFALHMMQEEAIAELKKAMADAAAKAASATPPARQGNQLLPSVFEQRLALHSQLNDDADRFTESEAEYVPYVQSAA